MDELTEEDKKTVACSRKIERFLSQTFFVAEGEQGDLGIMPGHTALLTKLLSGPVRVVKQNGEEEIFYVSGGFLEVQPNSVTPFCHK